MKKYITICIITVCIMLCCTPVYANPISNAWHTLTTDWIDWTKQFNLESKEVDAEAFLEAAPEYDLENMGFIDVLKSAWKGKSDMENHFLSDIWHAITTGEYNNAGKRFTIAAADVAKDSFNKENGDCIETNEIVSKAVDGTETVITKTAVKADQAVSEMSEEAKETMGKFELNFDKLFTPWFNKKAEYCGSDARIESTIPETMEKMSSGAITSAEEICESAIEEGRSSTIDKLTTLNDDVSLNVSERKDEQQDMWNTIMSYLPLIIIGIVVIILLIFLISRIGIGRRNRTIVMAPPAPPIYYPPVSPQAPPTYTQANIPAGMSNKTNGGETS